MGCLCFLSSKKNRSAAFNSHPPQGAGTLCWQKYCDPWFWHPSVLFFEIRVTNKILSKIIVEGGSITIDKLEKSETVKRENQGCYASDDELRGKFQEWYPGSCEKLAAWRHSPRFLLISRMSASITGAPSQIITIGGSNLGRHSIKSRFYRILHLLK